MKNILTEALVNSATNASFIFQLYKFCKVKVKSALDKVNVKNYEVCNNYHCYTYKPNKRENVYIYKIVNYIMSVN